MIQGIKRLYGPLVLVLFIFAPPVQAGWLSDTFIDPSDGHLDTSNWLLKKRGLLPVPILITEPAVGYGGGVAAVYFHDTLSELEGKPPTRSVVAGAKTENGTWFAGVGHAGIWNRDRIRYTGGLGVGFLTMDYYGLSGFDGRHENQGVRFETDALFLTQELLARLGESDVFAGIAYTLIDTTNTFKLNLDETRRREARRRLPGVHFDSRSAALGALLTYDNRDNALTPNKGTTAQIKAMFFNETWGGDKNFEKYHASLTDYRRPVKSAVLGLRAVADTLRGNAPFYAYPFIDMRGVKAMRYQGEQTVLGEAELRWSVTPRWALVGFGGAGKAFNNEPKGDSDVIYTKGVGMRYLIASKLGLQMGLDIARGPEETAFYVQFGGSWAMK